MSNTATHNPGPEIFTEDPETETHVLNNSLFVRLNIVRKAIGYVQKDANIDGRYMAVSHDQVTSQIRDHLIDQGIFLIPSLKEGKMVEARLTAKGAQVYRYEAVYTITVYGAGCITDPIVFDLPAHADDSGDKAPGKTLSMAVKMAILKLFNLETGVNEESRLGEGKRILDHLKEEVQDYIDSNDSLAIHLLSRSVGEDVWADVYNSAPDGKKVKFKKILSAFDSQGLEVLQAINTAINTEDGLMAKENIADLTEGGKRLLAHQLGTARSTLLGGLVK